MTPEEVTSNLRNKNTHRDVDKQPEPPPLFSEGGAEQKERVEPNKHQKPDRPHDPYKLWVAEELNDPSPSQVNR